MSPPLSFSELALSACAGGAVSSVVTTPLDVIRVRTQATGRVSGGMATQFVIRMEGVAALWSGLRPALGTVVPATAIYMSLYDTLKEQHTPPFRSPSDGKTGAGPPGTALRHGTLGQPRWLRVGGRLRLWICATRSASIR